MVCVQVGYDLGLFDDEMFQIVLWMKPVKKGICDVSIRRRLHTPSVFLGSLTAASQGRGSR